MLQLLGTRTRPGQPTLTTYLNPYSYLIARQKKDLFSRFFIHLDGIVLVKFLSLFGILDVERKSFDMSSMAPEVFHDASSSGKSVYFIGTKPEVIGKAVEKIAEAYPELKIAGYRDGYFSSQQDRAGLIERVATLAPDIVICGMGTPVQEQFLTDLQDAGWSGVGYTCGGFLHQTASRMEYYPRWIDRYHLRWAYRIWDEPKLFKRYFCEYPKFVLIFLYDFQKHILRRSQS